jgi:hypothetical protein
MVLVCVIAFLIACLASIRSRSPVFIENRTEDSDVKMYRRVVQRLEAGDDYYQALGSELRKGHYYTGSVFNWRSPFHFAVIAAMTEPISRYVLAAAASAAIVMAALATERAGGLGVTQLVVTALAVSECFLFKLDYHLSAEVWSGVLILISVTTYAFGRWRLGVIAGILALFFRELALPYILVSAAIAAWRKRKRELIWWSAGLGIWIAYYLTHVYLVRSRITAADTSGPGWVTFGGPRFLLATTKMSLLLAFADWVSAVLLPIMLVGIAGWATGIGGRVALVVAVYMAAFSIVGIPAVNFYWGAITNPLLAFGLVWSAPALRDLLRALHRPQATGASPR